MAIRKMEVKSKSGILYCLDFNDKENEVTIKCLSKVGASSPKDLIFAAMYPLNLETVREGLDDITYKCPTNMNNKVRKSIRES